MAGRKDANGRNGRDMKEVPIGLDARLAGAIVQAAD